MVRLIHTIATGIIGQAHHMTFDSDAQLDRDCQGFGLFSG
jgi:hypothetical protein